MWWNKKKSISVAQYSCSVSVVKKPSALWVIAAALVALGLELSGLAKYEIMNWLVATHEFFHALAGWLTGGSVESIRADGAHGGVTYTVGGFYPLISCAGYLGTGFLGAMCLRYSDSKNMAKIFQFFCVTLASALLIKGKYLDGYGLGMLWALAVDVLIFFIVRSSRYRFVLALVGCLYLSMGFDDAKMLLIYGTDQTDAGLLANYLGMRFLALPIALGYAAAMAGMWFWAFKSLIKGVASSSD